MGTFLSKLPESVQKSFQEWQNASADRVLKVNPPMSDAFIALFYNSDGSPKNVAVTFLPDTATSSTTIIKNPTSVHIGKTMHSFAFDVEAGNESATVRLGANDLEKLANNDSFTWMCKMSKSPRQKDNLDAGYWYNIGLVQPATADVDTPPAVADPAAAGGK